MIINTALERPIFQQIADFLEDSILSGVFLEEEQVPSITEFATQYKINPATALKGVNVLVDKGILYKKRGLGMFVKEGAQAQLRAERKESFYESFIQGLVAEARRLGLDRAEIAEMIERGFDHEQA